MAFKNYTELYSSTDKTLFTIGSANKEIINSEDYKILTNPDTQLPNSIQGARFGTSFDYSNGLLAIGDPYRGRVYIYNMSKSSDNLATTQPYNDFFEEIELLTGEQGFGWSVSLYYTGTYYILAVANTNENKVYIYKKTTSTFINGYDGYLNINNATLFGYQVKIDRENILVSEPLFNSYGRVHLYNYNKTLKKSITPLDYGYYDTFGYSIDLNEGRIVVGAPEKDDSGPFYNVLGNVYIYNTAGNLLNYSLGLLDNTSTTRASGRKVAAGCGKIGFLMINSTNSSSSNFSYSMTGPVKILDRLGNFLFRIEEPCHNFAIGSGIIATVLYDWPAAVTVRLYDLNGTLITEFNLPNLTNSYNLQLNTHLGDMNSIILKDGFLIIGSGNVDGNTQGRTGLIVYNLKETIDIHFERIVT